MHTKKIYFEVLQLQKKIIVSYLCYFPEMLFFVIFLMILCWRSNICYFKILLKSFAQFFSLQKLKLKKIGQKIFINDVSSGGDILVQIYVVKIDIMSTSLRSNLKILRTIYNSLQSFNNVYLQSFYLFIVKCVFILSYNSFTHFRHIYHFKYNE